MYKRSFKERVAGKIRVLESRIDRTYWDIKLAVMRFICLEILELEPPDSYDVRKFEYNGFYGRAYDEPAGYTAKFIEWTIDPGITRCMCSDGKERLIPTYALVDFKYYRLPEQEKTGVLFGAPSSS